MNRKVLLLVLAVWVGGNIAQADGDLYVVAGGGGVGTNINSLPYSIKKSGFYYLSRDLTTTGDGIIVEVDNVTIDLMGFTMTGPGKDGFYGISMNGAINVEIRNGTVQGFENGIYEQRAEGKYHRISNVRAIKNSYCGISLWGGYHMVQGCTCSLNWTGINVPGGVTITGNVACNNAGDGITVVGANFTGSTIAGNVANGNVKNGITLICSGSVIGNIANGNGIHNFCLGGGAVFGKIAIMADRNSAYGLPVNYYVEPGTEGIQWGINAGSP